MSKVSFIHKGGPDSASYRYRAAMPARELGASLNDLSADTLVFAKPHPEDLIEAKKAKERGARIIVDYCDDHFNYKWYREIGELADEITCPTRAMAWHLPRQFRATVIADPYEFPEEEPHTYGVRLLWFGHPFNLYSLERILPKLEGYTLHIVTSGKVDGAIPWSLETMKDEFAKADIVILPRTAPYKSPNRAIEAIRQGCFVVAEKHPSLTDFPGIWIGDIKEGIEWTATHSREACRRTEIAQSFVETQFSPATAGSAWRTVTQGSSSTSEPVQSNGTDG